MRRKGAEGKMCGGRERRGGCAPGCAEEALRRGERECELPCERRAAIDESRTTTSPPSEAASLRRGRLEIDPE